MKNKSYIGISLVILVFGIIFIPEIVKRYQNSEIVKSDRLNRPLPAQKKSGLVDMGDAPYFSLTTQDNQTLNNTDLLGKVYVLEFFFSTCPTICPIMNENMKIIEKKFSDNKDFAIVSITINPKYDTPEVLKSHAEHLGITSKNWYFLTGTQDYIHALAKRFNLYVDENKEAAGGFEHSGLFALIDKEGKIRCRTDKFGNPILYYSGLNYLDEDGFEEDAFGEFKPGIDNIIEDIEKLLNE